MTVRLDEELGPTPSARRGLWRWLLVAGVGVLVVTLAVVASVRAGNRHVATDTSPSPASVSAAGEASSQPSVAPELRADPVIEQLLPGLNRCSVPAEGIGTSTAGGMETGFPRTVQGAVAQGLALSAFSTSSRVLNDTNRHAVAAAMKSKEGEFTRSDGWIERAKKNLNLNQSGQLLLADGSVDRAHSVVIETYPRYGAYRVFGVTTFGGQIDHVFVAVWSVTAIGIVAATGEIVRMNSTTLLEELTFSWQENGWRVVSYLNDVDRSKSPMPERSNIPFAVRASWVGASSSEPWCVPQDATEGPQPGYWWTK